MGQFSSYFLYEKFEQRGEQEAIPVYPNVYSIDADGTRESVIKLENDPECGYDPPTPPIYKWVNIPITQDYICDDCPEYQTRWVRTDETICSGTPTPTTKKLVANYNDGTTRKVDCNDSTTLTTGETKPSGYEYSKMTSAVIGNCVTSIGDSAFGGCSGLTSVTIPNSVTFIDEDAFVYCRSLTSITIPNSVTSIGYFAFNDCRSLTSITIPNSVTSIGSYAFADCSGLTSVTVNATTPPTLGTNVFQSTNNCPIYVPCQSVDLYKSTTNWSSYADRIQGIPPCDGNKKLVATYNDGTTREVECNDSTTLTTGETKPSGYAYTAMTSAVIGDCVTSIAQYAFYDCTSLTSIDIPNSVTSIGVDAFEHCTGLTSVTIGNNVTSIAQYAFADCTSLTSMTIGNNVTSIGGGAFYDCTSLTSIDIPNSVTSIDYVAFYECSGLTSVTIGSGVTSIGNSVFARCSGLTSVTVNATTPPSLGGGVFYATNNCPLLVPASSVNAYKSASGWSSYADRIQPIP